MIRVLLARVFGPEFIYPERAAESIRLSLEEGA